MKQTADYDSAGEEQTTEHTRWNFATIVAESGCGQTARAAVDPASVLPLFISTLSSSTVLVGMISVVQRLGLLLPQLPMAAVLGHRPRRAPFIRWGVFSGRLPFVLFAVYLWLRGTSNPTAVVWFLLFAWTSMHVGNGFIQIAWQDIIAKSIPPGLRGRFWGSVMFTRAIAGLAVGFLVRWVLGSRGPDFPQNYVILFTFAAVFFTLSAVGCALVREPIRPVLDRPESLRQVIAAAGPMLRRMPAFRGVVLVGMLGFGMVFTMPFYIVYATRELGVAPQMAGVYIWAGMLGGAIFSLIWGRINDRHGPRAVLRIGCIFVTLVPLLAIAVPAGAKAASQSVPGMTDALPYLFGLVFTVGHASRGALFMGTINYVFELANHQERPRYIGLFNTLSAPGVLVPLAVGWLLKFVPYVLVFSLVAALGVALILLSSRMPDPRRSSA